MQMRQLEAYRATMISGSATAAAKELFISQPSVSRLILDLEHSLGFKLFERKSGRLWPTPEGLRFNEHVASSFTGLEKLRYVAKQFRDDKSGRLHISASPALSQSFLPAVIRQFSLANPEVSISLDTVSSANVLLALQSNDTDIGFTNLLPDLLGVSQELLVEAVFVCALPPGHRLAEKDLVTVADIDGENLISLEPIEDFYWRRHMQILDDAKIKVRSNMSTQRSSSAYAMVAEGLGIGLLEPFSAALWQAHGVIIRPFKPIIKYPYTISYPTGKARTELALNFAKTAFETLNLRPLPFQELGSDRG